jgi:molecular chaperone GrpE
MPSDNQTLSEQDRIEPTLDRIEPTLDRVEPAPARSAAPIPDPVGTVVPGGVPLPHEEQAPQAAGDSEALNEARAQVAELKAKNAQLGEQVLRAEADMQNTRRRAEDEMAKARKFAIESFAESLLAVADSLEAGLAHQDGTAEQVREGAEATLRQLKSVLERNKVIEINPAPGEKFDPHRHQAISVVPVPTGSAQDANTVVNVLQKGYLIADRILRPALVTVAAPK